MSAGPVGVAPPSSDQSPVASSALAGSLTTSSLAPSVRSVSAVSGFSCSAAGYPPRASLSRCGGATGPPSHRAPATEAGRSRPSGESPARRALGRRRTRLSGNSRASPRPARTSG